jgi:hypothetical protein
VGPAGAVRQVTTSWLDGQPEPDRRGNINRDAHTSADEGAGKRVCHRCRARPDERFGYRLHQEEARVRVPSPECSVENLECSEKKATSEDSSTYSCGGITGALWPSRSTFEARLSPDAVSSDEPMVITRSSSCYASVHRNSRRGSQLVQKNWEHPWSLISSISELFSGIGRTRAPAIVHPTLIKSTGSRLWLTASVKVSFKIPKQPAPQISTYED